MTEDQMRKLLSDRTELIRRLGAKVEALERQVERLKQHWAAWAVCGEERRDAEEDPRTD